MRVIAPWGAEDLLKLDGEQREVALKALVRLKRDPEWGILLEPPKEHQRRHGLSNLEGLRSRNLGGFPQGHPPTLGSNLNMVRAITLIYRWEPDHAEGPTLTIYAIGKRMGSAAHRTASDRLREPPGHGSRRSLTRHRRRAPDYREGR